MRWPIRKSPVIGVDVGSRFIKAAQLAPSGGLAASCVVPREAEQAPLSAADVQRLHGTMYRSGFTGARIILAVPHDKLLCEPLELPPRTSDAPLDQIARHELSRIRKVNPDALEIDCWDVPVPARAAKASHVMAVGCLHSDANTIVDCFEREGLAVASLDVASQAMARACKPLIASSDEIIGILDIGFSAAVLIVLHMGQVCYHRVIAEAGLCRLHRELHERLDLDGDVIDFLLTHSALRPDSDDAGEAKPLVMAHFDALIRELRTSLSYVSQQYPDAPIGQVLICGGGGRVAGLSEYLEQSLRVSASAVKLSDAGPELLTAIGLAQHEQA
jgi:Tfp pilus assembly PilM family ATPase